MSEVDKIVRAFGEKLVTDIRASLAVKGVTYAGGGDSKLAAKTRFEIRQTSTGTIFNLIMPDYWYYVNNGRKPGPVSKEAQKDIGEWANRKGIVGKFQNENLITRQKARENNKRKLKPLKKLPFAKAKVQVTFLISRKITLKGYEGNSFLDDVLNDGRLAKFKSDLGAALKKDILIEIRK
jgi:hypothetical protein